MRNHILHAQYLLVAVLGSFLENRGIAAKPKPGQCEALAENWRLQSSVTVKEAGAAVSSSDYKPDRW